MTVLDNLIKELRELEDDDFMKSSQKFFKENIRAHGIRTPDVKKIAKKYFNNYIRNSSKRVIFDLCRELWKTEYQEESYIASEWSYILADEYEEEDFEIFEEIVMGYVDNWAKCDTFCNHTIGAFLELYPKYIKKMKQWAKSHDRWVQRASAVSLIMPLKKGLFKKDIFEISDILIGSKDDMVQKGYGWALKVCSTVHSEEVCKFLKERHDIMPRVAYRYAMEKLSTKAKEMYSL